MASCEASVAPSARSVVVVIGGGMAGLAAAEALVEAGRRAVFVEPTGRPGGVLDTVRHDGWSNAQPTIFWLRGRRASRSVSGWVFRRA
jgi:protoporphyrinogen oxidase